MQILDRLEIGSRDQTCTQFEGEPNDLCPVCQEFAHAYTDLTAVIRRNTISGDYPHHVIGVCPIDPIHLWCDDSIDQERDRR